MKSLVSKENLLEILRENKKGHKAIFDEAVEGYKAEAVKILEEHIEQIRNGGLIRVAVSLPVPENHIADYERVIRMVELGREAEILLDEVEFSSYVMDDWAWKRQFITSNSLYSETAMRMSGQ